MKTRIFIVLFTFCFNWLFADPSTKIKEESQKIILVLGSGGTKGLAHVGVIEELENLGIVPDAIVGCSSGALIGALYAQHRDIAKVKEILIDLTQEDIIDFNFFQKHAISTREKLEKFLEENLTVNDFSALSIPFVAVASDLQTGKPVYFDKGDLYPALLASSALPALFPPYRMEEKILVDGGICDPLPVGFARTWKNAIVIASDISPSLDGFDVDNLFQVIRKSLEVAYQRLAYNAQNEADILLKMDFEDISSPIDDSLNYKIYEKGKESVIKQTEKIKEKIFQDKRSSN